MKIYERRVILLADGADRRRVGHVGSTNLDWRSFLHNHELNAVVLGAEFGSQVQAMFDKDLAASEAITLEQWQRRSLDLRIKELLPGSGSTGCSFFSGIVLFFFFRAYVRYRTYNSRA